MINFSRRCLYVPYFGQIVIGAPYITFNGDAIWLDLGTQSKLTMHSQSITTFRVKKDMRRKREA